MKKDSKNKNTRIWKQIKFSDIFDVIKIAKSSDLNNLNEGNIPFVGRSSVNNGFQREYEIEKEKIIKKNCITVSMVGEPRAFYQEFDFACSQNILILRNDKYLNSLNAQYLCSIINKYLKNSGYGYGYPVGLNRIKRSFIFVPHFNNEPDWVFMEKYISKIVKKHIQKIHKLL